MASQLPFGTHHQVLADATRLLLHPPDVLRDVRQPLQQAARGRGAWPQGLWLGPHTHARSTPPVPPLLESLTWHLCSLPQPVAFTPGHPPLMDDPKVWSPTLPAPNALLPSPDGEGHGALQRQSVGHHHRGGQTHGQHVGECGQQVLGLYAGLQQGWGAMQEGS